MAQAAGGGVARVGEGLETGRFLACIHGREAVLVHIDFAAYFEQCRRSAQAQRNGADSTDIGSDVFAGRTIAAGRGADQHTVLVEETDGEPVELRLSDKLDCCKAELLGAAPMKVSELCAVEDVGEGQHRQRMTHSGELRSCCASDALSR